MNLSDEENFEKNGKILKLQVPINLPTSKKSVCCQVK
jgi:hypothetical protein